MRPLAIFLPIAAAFALAVAPAAGAATTVTAAKRCGRTWRTRGSRRRTPWSNSEEAVRRVS
jgi:hypothetical protein